MDFTVTEPFDRLDTWLVAQLEGFSRSRVQGLIKSGFVTVDGNPVLEPKFAVTARSLAGQIVTVSIPPPVPAVPEPEAIPLDVIFEDDDIVVINKPAGLVVHPAPGHFTGTLVNALLAHCPNLSGIGGVARPGIVHRLDQDTSGLIVVAKTQVAMDSLVKAFAAHDRIEKTYLAVCHGRPRLDAGRIENQIGRHPVDRKRMAVVTRGGKTAITNWRVLSVAGAMSLVECRIETGRTHQIRVHMASMGCPVIGDATYGKHALDRQLDPVPARQMLHAWRLRLWHPVKNVQMEFVAPVPDDLGSYLKSEI